MSSDEFAKSPQRSSSRPRAALKRVQRYPDRPAPAPVQIRMTPISAAGTLLWTVALVLTNLFRDQLVESGNEWWITCAVCGVAVGILGTAVMAVFDRRHKSSEPSSS